ncbi:MAG: sugar nucleotide-binding protein [Chlamydiia bacterium]|nr:sugar nucleotide-binding protein [Chlamydiia bacterium]
MKQVLLIGARSFIGTHWLKWFPSSPKTDHKLSENNYLLNLISPDLSSIPLEGLSHALITAGWTNIASCEENPEKSYACNVTGTLSLAKKLSEKGICPILFSTDAIFDGNLGNYSEKSLPSPVNHYSRQKVELEKQLPEVCKDDYLLLRLSKIFSLEKGDGTLLDEMTTTLKKGNIFRAATDQIFCPLLIDDLIEVLYRLIQSGARGLFNVAGQSSISRYDLAIQLSKALNLNQELIQPIKIDALDTSIKRSKNTSLNISKLVKTLSFHPTPLSKTIQLVAD